MNDRDQWLEYWQRTARERRHQEKLSRAEWRPTPHPGDLVVHTDGTAEMFWPTAAMRLENVSQTNNPSSLQADGASWQSSC